MRYVMAQKSDEVRTVIAVYKSIKSTTSPSKAPNIHCDRYEKGVRTL